MIRAVITEIMEGVSRAVKRFSANGRPGEVITNRELMQQYGFSSRPRDGAEGIILKQGNCLVMIATEDRRYRLRLEDDGDVAIYTDQNHYVRLTAAGETRIKSSGTVVVECPDIRLGDGSLKRLITEDILAALNNHTHLFVGQGTVQYPVAGTVTNPAPVFGVTSHATSKVRGS